MIVEFPAFDADTGYLPPGIHPATLAVITHKLGFTVKRQHLIRNLGRVARNLFEAGVAELYVDGSFVTMKPSPGDIDGYWVLHDGVDLDRIDPILLDFTRRPDLSGRPKFLMWHVYGVELFVHPVMKATSEGLDYPTFFSTSREDVPRGYLRVMPEREEQP